MVLSACQTAVDPALARILWQTDKRSGSQAFASGAVASAAHSLMLLGIPAVMATLWKIDDQATALLMSNFYQSLAQGMAIGTAFHHAQASMIERQDRYSQPYYWAGFVFYGY